MEGLIFADYNDKKECQLLKINPDGGREYYAPSASGWVLSKTEPAPADASHTHKTFGNINFTGKISSNGDAGITGSKTIGGYKVTFKNGLLTGFDPIAKEE